MCAFGVSEGSSHAGLEHREIEKAHEACSGSHWVAEHWGLRTRERCFIVHIQGFWQPVLMHVSLLAWPLGLLFGFTFLFRSGPIALQVETSAHSQEDLQVRMWAAL